MLRLEMVAARNAGASAASAGWQLSRVFAQQQPQQLGVCETVCNACYPHLHNRNALTGASFSSSVPSSSGTKNPGDTGDRPSTSDDRVDLDRYTRADDTPVLGGIAPTEEEGIEIRRAEAGDNIFTAGETQGECIPAATIQDHPATESAMDIMPHQHKSATTADFSGNPTRDEEPDTNTLKEGHAIPNEAADSH